MLKPAKKYQNSYIFLIYMRNFIRINNKTQLMKKIILTSVIAVFFLSSCNCTKKAAEKTAAAKTEQTNTVSDLDGTWELNYISGAKIAFEGLYPDKKPFVLFNTKENRASGNSSCNSFTGNVSINENWMRFDENMAMTKMFCPGDGENAFIQSLQKVNAYAISDGGKTLNLLTGDIAIMRFSKK